MLRVSWRPILSNRLKKRYRVSGKALQKGEDLPNFQTVSSGRGTNSVHRQPSTIFGIAVDKRNTDSLDSTNRVNTNVDTKTPYYDQ